MVLDSSAIVAVMLKEPDDARLTAAMASADALGIGAPTLAECGIVLGNRIGFERRGLLLQFLQTFGVAVIPFGDLHWQEALDAYERYGRGRHRAALNFGDCMAYATARLARRPLLCVGDGFARTDLDLVRW